MVDEPAEEKVWDGLSGLAGGYATAVDSRLLWIYCPDYAGDRGNERTDRLAGITTRVISLARQKC